MPFNSRQPNYIQLRSIVAERTDRVVFWIGAGLSAWADLPLWPDLAERLTRAARLKAETLDSDGQQEVLGRLAEVDESSEPWDKMEILSEVLGRTSFRSEMRALLSHSADCQIPEPYTALWKLKPWGVVNLNLDLLAHRAFQTVSSNSVLVKFVGFHAGEFLHVLQSPSPFLLHVHGEIDHPDSWVLTRRQLVALSHNEGHRKFLESILTTSRAVFLGLSPQDTAVGSHLSALVRSGVSLESHFWLTSRRDLRSDGWAEEVGLQPIRYRSSGSDHCELLEVFSDLLSFLPAELEAAPVVSLSAQRADTDPSREALEACRNPEEIRGLLNSWAKAILSDGTPEAYSRYTEFCNRFDDFIYRAWYVSTTSPTNRLLDYTLNKELGKGAFGHVYDAVDIEGRPVAVKVLREEVRRVPEMLQSFRRGVRSMRILSSKALPGVVPYLEASEIPALVVMDRVNGLNLREMSNAGLFSNWHEILIVCRELARIIRSAHSLPERVLHRDIRPANVMIENPFSPSAEWWVVVLDFDLSWHKDALEKSVVQESALSGFLAPELVTDIGEYSKRHAKVDSFGLAMTFYFVATGQDPFIHQYRDDRWEDALLRTVAQRPCREWNSLPRRFARMILKSTQTAQSDRWDVGQIQGELERLSSALGNPDTVEPAELLAEEIASRCSHGVDYEWNPEELKANLLLLSGLRLSLTGHESRREIILEVSQADEGQAHRRSIARYLRSACERSEAALRRTGWKRVLASADHQVGVLKASVPTASVRPALAAYAHSIDQVIGNFQFK